MGSFWSGIKRSFIKFRGILTLHSHKCTIKKQRSFLWGGGGGGHHVPFRREKHVIQMAPCTQKINVSTQKSQKIDKYEMMVVEPI